jgi:hypothetical protein
MKASIVRPRASMSIRSPLARSARLGTVWPLLSTDNTFLNAVRNPADRRGEAGSSGHPMSNRRYATIKAPVSAKLLR